jgi:hypothetical protein
MSWPTFMDKREWETCVSGGDALHSLPSAAVFTPFDRMDTGGGFRIHHGDVFPLEFSSSVQCRKRPACVAVWQDAACGHVSNTLITAACQRYAYMREFLARPGGLEEEIAHFCQGQVFQDSGRLRKVRPRASWGPSPAAVEAVRLDFRLSATFCWRASTILKLLRRMTLAHCLASDGVGDFSLFAGAKGLLNSLNTWRSAPVV